MSYNKVLGSLLVIALLFLTRPETVEARRVFLNNVPISSVRNQTFKNVTVTIDAMGNVYIQGKQYKVQIQGPPQAAGTTPPPTTPPAGNTGTTTTEETTAAAVVPSRAEVGPAPSEKYVMLIQRSAARASGFSATVRINGRIARQIPLHVEQDVIDLTPFLKQGSNQIIVEAFKKSVKHDGTLNLKIYPGTFEGGQVKIKDEIKLDYTRKSTELNNFRHEYSVYFK